MIGETISHYRILEKLGEGGMGAVYKAEDLKLRRTVALKFLPAHAIESRERFLREAQAAASLNHPNICTIYEIDEEHGFIAMEHVEGQSVKDKIRERPLPLEDALDITIQVCTGLQTAHEKGVVHRDIKPANLMMNGQGQVKIMDFGLAQMSDLTRITQSGVSLGTPAYMSPEQARGDTTDRRTDLWSIGIVLYEVLCGRTPFRGANPEAVSYNILHHDPEPLTALRSGLPQDIDLIVSKALRKDPATRYQNAADLIVDLRHAGSGSFASAKPVRRRWVWAMLPSVLVIAGLLSWRQWGTHQTAEPLRSVTLTTTPGAEQHPTFSPGGDQFAFTWAGPRQDNPDIYVQQIGSAGSPLRLTTDSRSDSNPGWSRDGRWIAFLRGDPVSPLSTRSHDLMLIAPLGGAERRIAGIRTQEVSMNPTYLAWCPQNDCVVVTDSQGEGKPDALFVVSVQSGEKRRLTNPGAGVLADNSPSVSPDGRWLVFRRLTAWARGDLYLLALGEGMNAIAEPRRLRTDLATTSNAGMHASLTADYPAWMPDSQEILFSARGSLWRLRITGAGQPARIPFVGEDGLMPVVSKPQPDQPGRLIYVRYYEDPNIWRIDTPAVGMPASSPPRVAITSSRADIHPRFSPDGSRIAFASDRTGAWEIWLANPDGSKLFQLTSMGDRATGTGSPHWSPDGRQIVFASDADGQFEIYVIPVAGGMPRRLTTDPAFDHGPRFSRDSKWIYFNSQRGGDYHVWKIPSAGGGAVQITRDPGHVVGESPDGEYVYYVGTSVAGSPLWRVPASGGQREKIVEGIIWWSAEVDAHGIYYLDQPAGEARLQFFDLAKRKSTTLAQRLGDWTTGLSVSPDGRTILFSRRDSSIHDLMLVENFR